MSKKQEDFTRLGLSSAEVEQSRRKHGANVLTPPERPSVWKLYIEKFKDPIIRILLLAAFLSLVLAVFNGEGEGGSDYLETIGIFIAILLATSISFYFELDAARRFEELNALGRDNLMTVARDGRIVQVKRSEIVVGDVVLLEQGVEVPADGELLEAVSLQINESSLTGELLVSKTTVEADFEHEATYPSNHVMRSTLVSDGHGVMRVLAVGDATEIGRVSEQATTSVEEQTPLGRQLDRLASFISRIAFTIAIVAFFIFSAETFVDVYQKLMAGAAVDWPHAIKNLLEGFMMSVALIVMAVPEGLPMAVSLSLALNMRRMLKTNNLVRKMHACETMGAVTVICTDKTGTLTQNKMHVADMWVEGDAAMLSEALAVNTTAHIQRGEDGAEEGVGNPTECALLMWLHAQGHDYAALREGSPVVSQLTFSTEQKYMATLVRSASTGRRILYVKGAPEIVSQYCSMPDEARADLGCRAAGYQASAMRTLLMACREVDTDDTDCIAFVREGGLQVQALAGIEDPVREEVPAAVEQCMQAGIGIKIVTGDTQGTAVEIARRIGLWQEGDTPDMHITGPEFAALTDDEARARIKHLKVMSRARPLNKQRLVQLLQQEGEVVAVTGDGTNDAPALNFAQVGLSMGSGTSIAKEASDITLLDDSFRSIATAVMWGRSLYKNIQRFVAFQLTINLAALLVVLGGVFIGMKTLPLTVTQILWINIIMDTFAALALSTIAPSPSVMLERPRNTRDFIVSSGMKWNIGITGLCFFGLLFGLLLYWQGGGGITTHELTIFFTIFVVLQVWNLLNAKELGGTDSAFAGLGKERVMLLVMLLIIVGQVVIVSFGGGVFRTVPLTPGEWLVVIGATSAVLWIGEIYRASARLFGKKENV